MQESFACFVLCWWLDGDSVPAKHREMTAKCLMHGEMTGVMLRL
jgi:hypothetical protein